MNKTGQILQNSSSAISNDLFSFVDIDTLCNRIGESTNHKGKIDYSIECAKRCIALQGIPQAVVRQLYLAKQGAEVIIEQGDTAGLVLVLVHVS
jgi:hypothetical protein